MTLTVRPFGEADFEALIALWHRTKRATYDFIEIEKSYTIDTDRAFFREHVVPRCDLWVAVEAGSLAGFLAIEGSYVDRLYVDVDRQRSGIGAVLLDKAKELSPSGIELHTHQKNWGARCFYRKQGMVAVHFGASAPPESEPDLFYRWRPAPPPDPDRHTS